MLNGVNQDTVVFYDEEDEKLVELVNEKELYKVKSYKGIPLVNNEIESEGNNYPLQIFGHHNMKNLSAAINICLELDSQMEP